MSGKSVMHMPHDPCTHPNRGCTRHQARANAIGVHHVRFKGPKFLRKLRIEIANERIYLCQLDRIPSKTGLKRVTLYNLKPQNGLPRSAEGPRATVRSTVGPRLEAAEAH